jgi:hypothetical protein
MRYLLRVAAQSLLGAGLAGALLALSPTFVTDARAEITAEISLLDVEAQIGADGAIDVRQNVTFVGTAPETFSQDFTLVQSLTGNWQRRYRVDEIAVTIGDATQTPTLQETDGTLNVSFATGGAQTPITISYRVHGAATRVGSGETVVSWALAQGLPYPVAVVDATVGETAQFTRIDCAAGNATHPGTCTYYSGGTHDQPIPAFHHEALPPNGVVEATLRFAPGTVSANEDVWERWSLDRAFSAGAAQLGVVAAILLVGGLALWLTHRRFGRDSSPTGPVRVAEFHPVGDGQAEFRVLDGMRPGLVGTVMDERVDPIDVTATLLDLAVRGQLLITELPRESAHAPTEWTFNRRNAGTRDNTLGDFERTLLDQIAPPDGEPLRVSELAGTVVPIVQQMQSQMYEEVTRRGWFRENPAQTRSLWNGLAFGFLAASVAATVVLAAFTSFALVGLALTLLAVTGLFVATEMPSRTPAGVGVLQGLDALRSSLATQPVTQLPEGREIEQISQILPFTVVLGSYDRWLDALVSLDDDPDPDPEDLYWYHAPATWNLADLPASLRGFIVTVQGTLFSRR